MWGTRVAGVGACGQVPMWDTLQGMITLILATDMARHAEIMEAFKEKVDSFDFSNEEHRTLVSLGVQGSPGRGEDETLCPPALGLVAAAVHIPPYISPSLKEGLSQEMTL